MKLLELLENLEELDDVPNVYANLDIPEANGLIIEITKI